MSWGPIIRHDGKGCPVPAGTRVLALWETEPNECYWGEGVAMSGAGLGWDWRNWRKIGPDGYLCARIIRYRVWKDDARAKDDARELERVT